MNDTTSQQIRLEKITLNIGTGTSGPKLEKAKLLISQLANAKPVERKTKKRIPGWGLRPGLAIGCKVTLRRKKAEQLLKKLLQAVDNKISASQFDKFGNLAFGIKEYLEIPSIEYNPEIGIMGLEVAVTFYKHGYRIKKRRLKRTKMPNRHKTTKDEAVQFMKKDYGVSIEE